MRRHRTEPQCEPSELPGGRTAIRGDSQASRTVIGSLRTSACRDDDDTRLRIAIDRLGTADAGVAQSPAQRVFDAVVGIGYEQVNAIVVELCASTRRRAGRRRAHLGTSPSARTTAESAQSPSSARHGETGLVTTSTWTADVGDVCVPDEEVKEVDIVKLVIREFKRMEWPASDLVVQPPGGKTLVNFETNFYTEQPADPEVGHGRWARGSRSVRDTHVVHLPLRRRHPYDHRQPGAAAPEPRRDPRLRQRPVPSASASTRRTAASTASATATGLRSRTSLTVAGATQDLEVVEAVPQLVLE